MWERTGQKRRVDAGSYQEHSPERRLRKKVRLEMETIFNSNAPCTVVEVWRNYVSHWVCPAMTNVSRTVSQFYTQIRLEGEMRVRILDAFNPPLGPVLRLFPVAALTGGMWICCCRSGAAADGVLPTLPELGRPEPGLGPPDLAMYGSCGVPKMGKS